MAKKYKVYVFSDNADYNGIVFQDISDITGWIEADEHKQSEYYEYTIIVEWMTRKQINELSECD